MRVSRRPCAQSAQVSSWAPSTLSFCFSLEEQTRQQQVRPSESLSRCADRSRLEKKKRKKQNKWLQVMAEQPESRLAEAVAVVNSSYPEEIVRYYSPTYSTQLLQKLDAMAATAGTVGA